MTCFQNIKLYCIYISHNYFILFRAIAMYLHALTSVKLTFSLMPNFLVQVDIVIHPYLVAISNNSRVLCLIGELSQVIPGSLVRYTYPCIVENSNCLKNRTECSTAQCSIFESI